MKQLFADIKNSVYSPNFYRELFGKPFSYSFKYYAGITMLFAVLGTIVASTPLVPMVNNFIREAPGKFFAYYPDDLEIRVDNGVVSANVEQPYFLPLPNIIGTDESFEGNLEHLITIDTASSLSFEQFRAYKSVIVIGKDQIALMNGDNDIRIYSLEKGMNLVVNEDILRRGEQQIAPYYKFIVPLMVLAIFVGLVITFAVKLVYLLFGALCILILGRFAIKEHWSYGTAYRIGLHAITLPILIGGFLSIAHLGFMRIPFLSTIIMLIVVYSNFSDLQQQKSSSTTGAETEKPAGPSA